MPHELYGTIARINAALARIEAVASKPHSALVDRGDRDAHERLRAAASHAVAALDDLIVKRSK